MELEQTYFPLGGGPNWTARIIWAIIIAGIAGAIYFICFHNKPKDIEDKKNEKQTKSE